jgi:hypothetical protein
VDTQPGKGWGMVHSGLVSHITAPKQYADSLVEDLVSDVAFLKLLRKANIKFEN